jgi:biopolymer transport protein ExbD
VAKKNRLKGLKQGSGAMGDINVTPLIDVVLVMLIIFMVITPITIHEMVVNLPATTEQVQKKDLPKDQLVAAVCQDGTVALNRKVMPLDELNKQIRLRLRGKPKKVVFVDGHPEAPYDQMVALMDSVRDAGAEKIGLASLKDPDLFHACTPVAAAPAPEDGEASPAAEG